VVVTEWRYRFLLDVWAEQRAVGDLPAVVRARVRDLSGDEISYVGSFAEVEAIIEARLDEAGIRPRRWERS